MTGDPELKMTGGIISDGEKSFLVWREGSGCAIEIFDVEASPRRSGSGRRMVDQLIKICERMGVRRIYAITRAENRIAQEWYEALHFKPRPLHDFYGVRTLAAQKSVDAVMYVRDLEMYP